MMQIVIHCIIMDVSPPTNSDTCASHQIFSSTEHRNCYYNQCVYLARECINSGLDYWNGGMVDWRVFVLVFVICHVVSIVLADLCYTFCVAGLPDFEGY